MRARGTRIVAGWRVRRVRNALRLTQAQLAERLGVSRETVCLAEATDLQLPPARVGRWLLLRSEAVFQMDAASMLHELRCS